MSNKKTIDECVPRRRAILAYYHLWVDGKADTISQGNPFLIKSDTEETLSNSEGEEHGCVVGCNLNNWNPNPSVRTVNGNNHAGNGNDYYVGASAVVKGSNTEQGIFTSQAASLKITENHTATGEYGQCDYDLQSLPFWTNDCKVKAESNATSYRKDSILKELKTANSKRKLKNLKRFVLSPVIIDAGFDRTMDRTHCRKNIKAWYEQNKVKVCAYIWYLLITQTYDSLPSERRVIHKRGKGDKDRNADIFDVFDRIIQNIILIVVEHKFRNMFPRNVFSGIKERSLLSNNSTFCMINVIRHWMVNHPDCYVGLTDIKHFYENTSMKVVFSVMFKTIVCPYMRWLLLAAFSKTKFLPIGGSLSQIMGMITIVGCDKEIIRRYHVFLCCFGDNRFIGDADKIVVRKAMEFQMSFYEGCYNLSVKGDYQIYKVKDGLRFCKYDYFKSFVKPRSEIRRRAIRAWRKGKQHYAGYKGIFDKTDCKHLKFLIENTNMEIESRNGMKVTIQRGAKRKHKDLPEGTIVIPLEYSFVVSEARMSDDIKKLMSEGLSEDEAKAKVEKSYFVRVTYLAQMPDKAEPLLCHSSEGSEEIVGFYKLVHDGKQLLRQRLHIGHEGNKTFYTEFHVTAKDAVDYLLQDKNIRNLLMNN